jgi:hypothetical protein
MVDIAAFIIIVPVGICRKNFMVDIAAFIIIIPVGVLGK